MSIKRNTIHFFAVGALLVVATFSGCAGPAISPAGATDSNSSAPSRTYSSDNRVELYGRHRCSICQGFLAQLNARSIAHTFYDVEHEPERAQEMWSLLATNFPDRKSVGLPVVLVNGTVLIQPAFTEFETYLKAAR